MTRVSPHHKYHKKLFKNQRGYSGIIASIFMVLIVLFLYFNVYTFMMDRNTAFQDTTSIVSQMDFERTSEQIKLLDVSYETIGNAVVVSGTLQNTGPVAIEVTRLWVQDLTRNVYGNLGDRPLFPFTLRPGEAKPFPSRSVSMNGLIDPNDKFTVWFATTRGNVFSVAPSTLNVSISGFFKTFGDFIPDYHSVRWAILDADTHTIDYWRSGWVVPESLDKHDPLRIIWRIDMTYFGEEINLRIADNTMLFFVPYSGKTSSQYSPFSTYIVNCGGSGEISLYTGNEVVVNPSFGGTPLTLYFGSHEIGYDPPRGMPTYWGNFPPDEYYGADDAVGAMMSLTIYGGSPSTYAQSFPLFAISNLGPAPLPQFYLTVNNGGHGAATGQGPYFSGAQASFSISPTAISGGTGLQYVFNGWIGTGSGSYTGPLSSGIVTMNNPITETANWKTQYEVLVASSGGGSVSPSGTAWRDAGSLSIQATPNAGYSFSSWSSIGSITFANPTSPTTTATINGPGTITATFVRAVTFVSAGTGSGTTGNPTPAYPTGLQANDLILLQVTVRDTTNAQTTPTGFTLLNGPDSTGTGRQWIYYKFSTGTESGSLTINIGGTNAKLARMYAFRNVALSSFNEGGGFGFAASSRIISAQSVTTTGNGRLAVSLVFVNANKALDSFTGETGGDWMEASEYSSSVGSGGCIQLQTATMTNPGTIAGGSYTFSNPAAGWGVRAFALIPVV